MHNSSLVTVVQKLDSAITRINLYPLDSTIGFPNIYPLDSDLSNLDSAIQLVNNWGLVVRIVCSSCCMQLTCCNNYLSEPDDVEQNAPSETELFTKYYSEWKGTGKGKTKSYDAIPRFYFKVIY